MGPKERLQSGGEADLVFIFWLLLVLLIGLQHLVQHKATIEASLSRLMVATGQVWKNMTRGLLTRKAKLEFNLQKAVVNSIP
jgi:hypothetical protein